MDISDFGQKAVDRDLVNPTPPRGRGGRRRRRRGRRKRGFTHLN
jgi:hypothetical protein